MLDEGHDYGGPSASFMAQPQTSAVVDFVRGRSSSTTAIRRPAKSTVRDDDDTQSQQLTVRSPSHGSLMKRALSFQVEHPLQLIFAHKLSSINTGRSTLGES